MKPTRITWIGLLVTLSALTIPTETIASETSSISETNSHEIENRLARIAKTLKQRERELSKSSDAQEMIDDLQTTEITRSWLKGYRGGFVNGYRGGFVNGYRGGFANRRWLDGRGFWNRRYRY